MKLLSLNFGHDASLCIFVSGELIDFVEVERESRFKRHLGLKSQFIHEYLIRNNFAFEEFDAICVSGTQCWGSFHDKRLKIKYGYSPFHKTISKNFASWDLKNVVFRSPKFNHDHLFINHISKQHLDLHTPSPLKRFYTSSYIPNFISNPKALESSLKKVISIAVNKKREQQEDFFVPLTIELDGTEKPGFYVDHHAAHAFYAGFYCKKKAIIVTHDGGLPTIKFNNQQSVERGFNSGGIYIFEKDIGLTPILSHNFSLGFIYESVAKGFKIDSGKLMGLASYGKFQRSINSVVDSYVESLYGQEFSKQKLLQYVSEIYQISTTEQNLRESKIKQFHFNFKQPYLAIQSASNAQYFVQRVYVDLISDICEKINEFDYSFEDVYMTGGFSLNCPTNSSLIAVSPCLNYKPLPGVADTGLSLGSAVALHYLLGEDVYLNDSSDPLAPAFPPSSLNAFLEKENFQDLQKIYISPLTIFRFIAKELIEGKVFCIHSGRSEIGPRALGHRSIIAWAGCKNIRDFINKRKGRENWRPLAPICSIEDFSTYFTGEVEDSRFMLTISKSKTIDIPAVTHVDNTARVQVIDQRESFLFNVLTELRNLGVAPVVVNTSFNCAGEPVVETFQDAVKSFIHMGFDYLISEKDIFIKSNVDVVK